MLGFHKPLFNIGLPSSRYCDQHTSHCSVGRVVTHCQLCHVPLCGWSRRNRLDGTRVIVDIDLHAHWHGEVISLQVSTESCSASSRTVWPGWFFTLLATGRPIVWEDGRFDASESLETPWTLWWTLHVLVSSQHLQGSWGVRQSWAGRIPSIIWSRCMDPKDR